MEKADQGKSPLRHFYTPTFEKIDATRREDLLTVALQEFADKGFNGTSINALARKAGVSIGSLYSYFPSKEDLFLTIVERGHDLLENALSDIDPSVEFLENYATLLHRAHDYAISNRELNLIYIDATTQGLRHFADRLSKSLESISIDLYRRLIAAAQARGELRADLDVGATVFCLDNLLVLFQFSFASDYYRDRLRLFLGLADETAIDVEALIDGILAFVGRALRP